MQNAFGKVPSRSPDKSQFSRTHLLKHIGSERKCMRVQLVARTEQIWKCGGEGHMSGAKWRKTMFLLFLPLHFFGSTSTISRFGERFRDGQYSLVSFLFAVLLLTVPPDCPANWNSEDHEPPCPMESAPLRSVQLDTANGQVCLHVMCYRLLAAPAKVTTGIRYRSLYNALGQFDR